MEEDDRFSLNDPILAGWLLLWC